MGGETGQRVLGGSQVYKVLLVDDNADTRNTLGSCFPWEQVSFEVAAQLDNGLDALSYLIRHPVDVVLCDIRMPKMDGIELAREVYERGLPVRLILLSAYRDFEYARKAMAYGVRQYLVKPAKYQEMLSVFTQMKQELDKEKVATAAVELPESMRNFSSLLEAQKDPIVQKIVRVVTDQYRTANLELAAKAVHMNPTYVSAYFKKKTGTNFSDFVQAYKMEKAAQFLAEGNWKIFQISEMVGYSNVKNFIRTFKNHFGQTPGQFQRR